MGRHAKEMTPAEAIRQLRAVEATLLDDVRVRGHEQHDLLEVTAGLVREVREFYEAHAPARPAPALEHHHVRGEECEACFAERHFSQ